MYCESVGILMFYSVTGTRPPKKFGVIRYTVHSPSSVALSGIQFTAPRVSRYPVYSSQPLECLKSLAIWVVVLCEASIADVFQYKWSLTILDEGVVVCVWGCANLQHVMGVWSRFVTLTTCVCLSNSVTSFKVSTCKDTRHK